MLKIRLMGTKNEIEWFEKIMQEHPDIEILKKSKKSKERQRRRKE